MGQIKNIAVLGSSGQIGTRLTQWLSLREKGYNVHGYDIVPSSSTTHVMDVSRRPFCGDMLTDYDFVFFLAFNCGGAKWLADHQHTHKYVDSNNRLMVNVFNSLQSSKTPFLYTSSQMSNMTFSEYGLLKLVGEMYSKVMTGVIVKFWNVYAVEHKSTKSHVITDFINKANETKLIDMLTDGTEERQFLYVDDACECLEKLMLQYDTIDRDKPLHITNFEWNTIMDVANTVAAQFPDTVIQAGEAVDNIQQGQKNEPDPYIREFWNPTTSLEDGIKDIITKTGLQPEIAEVNS